MSFSYLLGNLIGRLLMSFILVWIVWLLASRFDWRKAFARSKRWYSLVVVFALSVLGVASTVVSAGGLR